MSKLVRVTFKAERIGPDTEELVEFLKRDLEADLQNWRSWTEIEVEHFEGDASQIPEWVYEIHGVDCPRLEEDEHGKDCPLCDGTEVALPGWDPTESEGCAHEPEGHSVSYSGSDASIDVTCRKCGASGSFALDPHDINW